MSKKEQKHSQMANVLQYLKDYGKITSLDAIREFGATRLSGIIYVLRHEYNYNIRSERRQHLNKYGHNVNYVVYILEELDNV